MGLLQMVNMLSKITSLYLKAAEARHRAAQSLESAESYLQRAHLMRIQVEEEALYLDSVKDIHHERSRAKGGLSTLERDLEAFNRSVLLQRENAANEIEHAEAYERAAENLRNSLTKSSSDDSALVISPLRLVEARNR